MPKIAKVLLVAVAVLAIAVTAGTYGYIHFINDDTPERLTFSTSTTQAPGSSDSSVTTTVTAPASFDGTWVPTPASQVGYRVKEVLFGQDTEAVGRTSNINGSLQFSGTTVSSTQLTVDMTTVKSDQSNRDNQFRTRIMSTSEFPTATYALTKPIALPRLPSSDPLTVKATGNLTLRGVTKEVTTDLQVRLNGANVEINGSIPIVFGEWNIPNPSFGPASTEDNGELEMLVVFVKS